MSSPQSKKEQEIEEMVNDLNNEMAYSLTTLLKLKNSSEELKLALQLGKIRSIDIKAISSIAQILINQNQHLSDHQLASKLLKELSNSHPNRIIKKVSKKMVKRKWGEKLETE